MSIKIMSYNIWFDEKLREERTHELIKKIKKENPSIICLQEVTEQTHAIIMSEIQSEYKYTYPEKLNHKYGCITLSNIPIEKSHSVKYESNMGRQLDIMKIGKIIIMNTHFESEFIEDNKLKKKQYKLTSEIMKIIKIISDPSISGVILCSDTNMTETDVKEYNESFNMYLDAWIVDGQNALCENTYDTTTNELMKDSEKTYISRLDRIIYLTNNNNITQKKFQMLKGDNIEISDHYGIMTEFNIL
jgi:endonuclease/exonuclease/phosphatase family metal-dependent hydrolase